MALLASARKQGTDIVVVDTAGSSRAMPSHVIKTADLVVAACNQSAVVLDFIVESCSKSVRPRLALLTLGEAALRLFETRSQSSGYARIS